MKITTIGIDLAKNVFQFHGVDDAQYTFINTTCLFSQGIAGLRKIKTIHEKIFFEPLHPKAHLAASKLHIPSFSQTDC